MAITRITIENFKGIADRVEVDLKPITVLFGANSAGKSTLLQALLYLREILERRNADADQLQAGGSTIDLGGFHQLVHGHDLDRDVKIGVAVEVSDDGLPTFVVPEMERLDSDYMRDIAENGVSDISEVYVEVSIAWDQRNLSPEIREYSVSIDGQLFARIIAEAPQQCYIHGCDIQNKTIEYGLGCSEDHVELESSFLEEYLDRKTSIGHGKPQIGSYRVPADSDSAIPSWDKTILPAETFDESTLWEDGQEEAQQEYQEYAFAQLVISQLMVGSGTAVLEELQRIRYVGPLRDVPPRNFTGMRSPKEDRWANGIAAWDRLYQSASIPDGGALVMETSSWLNDSDKLDMSYSLEQGAVYEVSDDSYAMYSLSSLASNPDDDDIAERMSQILKDIENSPRKIRLNLRDLTTSALVDPCDIGVGVSQVIPVIVAALDYGANLAAIEQPELHLHPAVQARLGDLFIQNAMEDSRKRFILETHSEHLMLRFLRRVRECNNPDEDDSYPGYLAEINPDDISVYYIQSTDQKTEMLPLRISEDGDFLDRWPNGFFEERGEELF